MVISVCSLKILELKKSVAQALMEVKYKFMFWLYLQVDIRATEGLEEHC